MRCGLAFLTTLTQRKQGTLLSSGWIKDHSIDTTQPQVLRQRPCRKHFPVKTKDQTVAATMAAPPFRFRRAAGPAATAGLSVLPLGGPPSWAERPPPLIHRPNSGTRPTPQGTVFRWHSGAAEPPPAWSCCGGSPGTRRSVRRDRPSGRKVSGPVMGSPSQQTSPVIVDGSMAECGR